MIATTYPLAALWSLGWAAASAAALIHIKRRDSVNQPTRSKSHGIRN